MKKSHIMVQVHNENHEKRWPISDDFGSRSSVVQKKFRHKVLYRSTGQECSYYDSPPNTSSTKSPVLKPDPGRISRNATTLAILKVIVR